MGVDRPERGILSGCDFVARPLHANALFGRIERCVTSWRISPPRRSVSGTGSTAAAVAASMIARSNADEPATDWSCRRAPRGGLRRKSRTSNMVNVFPVTYSVDNLYRVFLEETCDVYLGFKLIPDA